MFRASSFPFASLVLVLVAGCVEEEGVALPASDELRPAATVSPPTSAIGLPMARHCRPTDELECHPQDPSSCAQGEGCYVLSESSLICAPAFPGGFGDPCDYANTCDPGLMCAASYAIEGCTNDVGCCTSFCEVGAPFACPGSFECVPILADDVPRCYADLGVCVST